MLKMYHTKTRSGSTPEFWEENWEAGQFEESVRFSIVDPLRPLFEEFLRSDSLMLEGGCGMGNYISYYTARGFNVIGLDFAQRALLTLHVRQPGLKLTGGDVSNLPFADETFDLYYSGGVVEHFEGGAASALAEARRVLKRDGRLLISVPYFNPLRKMLSRFRKTEWRVVDCASIDEEMWTDGMRFFQYAYTRREFSRMLAEAGLRVLKTQGYAVLWGLYDLPLIKGNGQCSIHPGSATSESSKPVAIDIRPLVKEVRISLAKRLIVCEDASVPVLGLGVTFFRWAVANMMMYICQRD